MSEERDTTSESSDEPVKRDFSEALLQTTLERLKARGDTVKRFACMQLPSGFFNDLCRKLLERTGTVKEAAEWLQGQTSDAPSRSSVERFSDVLFEEYRLVQLAERRGQAERYVTACANGDPDAMQMALNSRVTELLTDELMRAGDGGEIETKRLMTLLAGARMVAQTSFDKQKMDVRITALEGQIASREKDIQLKNQKIADYVAKQAATAAALDKVAVKGGKITPADIAEVRSAIFG